MRVQPSEENGGNLTLRSSIPALPLHDLCRVLRQRLPIYGVSNPKRLSLFVTPVYHLPIVPPVQTFGSQSISKSFHSSIINAQSLHVYTQLDGILEKVD